MTGPASTSAGRFPSRPPSPSSLLQSSPCHRGGSSGFLGGMTLPLKPPVLPQLAKSAKTLPTGDRWSYEPKWDGFRSIAFVDGDDVYLQSRNGKPLTRYFPELEFPTGRYILDGEIVLFDEGGQQDFDALGQRIHPAKSRIDMLAEETPTRYIAFDLLAEGDDLLLDRPQAERRQMLEQIVAAPVDL